MSSLRSPERIRAHYEIEVELADRLRTADAHERRRLYGRVYDELFRRVPDHPQLTRGLTREAQDAHAKEQVHLISQFLPADGTYVEIGAGDCATVQRVAEIASAAVAVEVSADIVPHHLPPNVEVRLSDGVTVPVDAGSADLVYSNQLMEHLHPDDAREQLREIARVLRPGGRYICITPNRLTGPHDISEAFDREARGFHLREYTYRDLLLLMREAGFRRLRVLERLQGRALRRAGTAGKRILPSLETRLEDVGRRAVTAPLAPYLLAETVAARWPGDPSRSRVFGRLLSINLLAQK